MKIRMIWGGLVASALLLVSGVALSGGGGTTSDNRLVNFDRSTGELWAYPAGRGMTSYLHRPESIHLIADLSRFTPPDPCLPVAEAWNETVERYEGNRGEIRDLRSHLFVFNILLGLLSDFQCHTSITSTVGAPQPILSIGPTAR